MKADLMRGAISRRYKSVRDFANAIGIPSSTIQSAIDNDKFDKMQVGTVIKICDALDIDIKTFLPIIPIVEVASRDETEILTMYRQADTQIKQTVKTILETCKPETKKGAV